MFIRGELIVYRYRVVVGMFFAKVILRLYIINLLSVLYIVERQKSDDEGLIYCFYFGKD